ncbi:MAG TPA: hypothetical protein VK822_27380 [Acetobacteraceae bacterium]|nr:hypothetical protein [Acetobacteraceae bacterium]
MPGELTSAQPPRDAGSETAIRRKRIDAAFHDIAPDELATMEITVDPDTDSNAWATTVLGYAAG